MAHDHTHSHGESLRDYFVEQLLGIMVCGLIGFVAVRMYTNGMLNFILAKPFHLPVLLGGVAVLLIIVLLRAIAVWHEAGALQAAHSHGPECSQDHTHGPDCDHSHAYPGHTHSHDDGHMHSHDMSWVFVTMLILVVPVILFTIGMPSSTMARLAAIAEAKLEGRNSPAEESLGAADLREQAKDAAVEEEKKESDGTTIRVLKTKSGLRIRETIPPTGEPRYALITAAGTEMRFNDLNDAAFDEAKRKSLEGQTAILEGRFKRLADKEFTLFRLKMTCCAADTVPLKVRILVPQAPNNIVDYDWVQVKGQIQFIKMTGSKDGAEVYIPVIMVADITDVRKAEPKNEYEQ
jgi:hypothetical protein